MKLVDRISGTTRKAALAAGIAVAVLPAPALAAPQIPSIPATPNAGHWREASLEDYRKHLNSLTTLVEACAKGRDLKNCDPLLVGPDDRVPLGNGPNQERRLIRYGWLRVLFSKAEEPDEPASSSPHSSSEPGDAQPPQPTTTQLLQAAEKRLEGDLAQSETVPLPEPQSASVRGIMEQVLAGHDFRNLKQPSVQDSLLEKVGNWLNRIIENAAGLRSRSAWVGRVIVWGFILTVCVGLVWGLLQLERKWRIRLVPEADGPAAGAASARDWQLWLEDARRAAASGRWREAIHFVYWASISRLESRRLWPADRARTPREYLALVGPEDPRKARLAQLTGSFEVTWYGGRAASEKEYLRAEELAQGLIAGPASARTAELPAAPEGGRA